MSPVDSSARSGGELLVDTLEAQGVDRVFCVPGESYLAVLDALHDSPIETIVARQEGGAAMMAEADGKLTGRPGICFVTRGPGATNAASGVHVAKQDSTPMILFVGQIGRAMRGREAFQEVDYRQTFGDVAKWAEEIDDPARIPEVLSHAFHVAMNGRPGPVVLSLPEDMLTEMVSGGKPGPRVEPAEAGPTARQIAAFREMLEGAERPFMVLGGSRWTPEAAVAAQDFAQAWDLPTSVSFRRQNLFDATHAAYAGDVGLGINPALKERLEASDLLILLGARFSENPSQDFSVLGMPTPGKRLVHVHPGPEELGRIYAPELSVAASPASFVEAIAGLRPDTPRKPERIDVAHGAYLKWSTIPESSAQAPLALEAVFEHLGETLPPEAVLANGAGNYAIWLNRFHRFRRFGTMAAPTSGSMGYGLPAAIASKLRKPDAPVVCLAGDGCFQMTSQEFGTAAQYGAGVVVLLCDNGRYGTIKMHQAKRYPGRVSATDLVNPDFAALARAYDCFAATVETNAAFPAAFAEALAASERTKLPSLLHLKLDPDRLTPALTASSLEGGA